MSKVNSFPNAESLSVCRRADMTEDDMLSLTTFLGKQLRLLHTLPLPVPEQMACDNDQREESLPAETCPGGKVRSRGFKEAKHDSKSSYTDEFSAQPRNEISRTSVTTAVPNTPQLDDRLQAQWEVPKSWDPFVLFLRNQRQSLFERFKER